MSIILPNQNHIFIIFTTNELIYNLFCWSEMEWISNSTEGLQMPFHTKPYSMVLANNDTTSYMFRLLMHAYLAIYHPGLEEVNRNTKIANDEEQIFMISLLLCHHRHIQQAYFFNTTPMQYTKANCHQLRFSKTTRIWWF